MKKVTVALLALTFGAQFLVGCGGQNLASTQLTKSNLQVQTSVTAQSYTSNTKIYRLCTDALDEYSSLLRDWDYTSSDSEKDRIEMRMLRVLTDALRDSKSAANYSYDSERIVRMANNALDRYSTLYRRWENTYSTREKRLIVNDMLRDLTTAVKDIQRESRR